MRLLKREKPYEFPSRFPKKRERIIEIDALRGFCIILMLLLHLAFLVGNMELFFQAPDSVPEWIESLQEFARNVFAEIDYIDIRTGQSSLYVLEFFFSSLFIFIAGISCSLTKSNFKRGLRLAYVAVGFSLIIELGNVLFDLGIHIYFGILHALAAAILLYSLFDHFLPKWWQTYIAGIALAILLVFMLFKSGMAAGDMEDLFFGDPIHGYYMKDVNQMWKMFVGLKRAGDDYFDPISTTCILFLGAAFGKTFYRNKKSLWPKSVPSGWLKPLAFIGRHTLVTYVAHMVIAYVLVFLIFVWFGYRLPI